MSAFTVNRRSDGVAIVTLDQPGKPVNSLSPELLAEFEAKVLPVLDDPEVTAAVLVSGKPSTFIAGADLEILPTLDATAAEELSRRGNAILSRVATSGKPVVAAVHGAALGGGLEVALACHYIIASDDPATVLGLPEVMLGVLPGGGGTQRLPRRVGLPAALQMMLTGKRIRAKQAYRMGLVDALTTPGGITETGARAALLLASGKLKRRRLSWGTRLTLLPPARWLILRTARRQTLRRTLGLYPAPEQILECVATGLSRGVKRGLEREATGFGVLVPSRQAASLVGLFHAMNDLKKLPDDGKVRDVRRLGVLGGGFMGAGVASISVGLCPVVVRDISDDALAGCARIVHQGLAKQLRSRSIARVERDRRWSALTLTRQLSDLKGADLVVEAVFEDLELKRRVVAELEEVVSPDAVIASNTSALPIAEITAEARFADRFVGMHYFSPVPKMPLLELVAAEKSAPWAVAMARKLGIAQGKTVIVVKDGPGFYTTRILAGYLNEALLLLEEGARIEAVDAALKGFGFPVGPVALIDEVGIDVGAHVTSDMARRFADRGLKPSELLSRLAEAGLAGRKSRCGFYTYPKKGRKKPNARVYKLIAGRGRRTVDTGEMQERLALMMVNEAAVCLQDGVIASPRDGDVGAILGLGFPPFRGGPFRYVDEESVSSVVRRLEELARQHGPRFSPAPLLLEMSAKNQRFYQR